MAEKPITGGRAILELLDKIGYGKAVADLSHAYEDLMREMHAVRVDRGGKIKGEMTIKLGFVLDEAGMTQVAYDKIVKPPKVIRPGGVLFMNAEGQLQASNPRQPELPNIRDVSADDNDIKDAADAAEG